MSALLLSLPDVSAGIDLSFRCYGTAAHVALFMLPPELRVGGGVRRVLKVRSRTLSRRYSSLGATTGRCGWIQTWGTVTRLVASPTFPLTD